MKSKVIKVLLTFFLGVVLCTAFSLLLNNQTPVLQNGQENFLLQGGTQYSLSGFCEGKKGEWNFTLLLETDTPPLTLTLCDAGPFTLYMNNTLIYTYRSSDAYSRILSVELGPLPAGKTTFNLCSNVENERKELLSGQIATTKLLLGTTVTAVRHADLFRRVTSLSIGLYMMMVFCSLVLYMRKRREKYLLSLAIVALMSMTVTLVDAYDPLRFLTLHTYSAVRSSLFICPVVFIAAINCYLLYAYLPKRLQPLLSFRFLAVTTVIIVLIQYFSSYNFNYVVRLLLLIPMLLTFIQGAKKNARGAYILAMGCGISEGARVVIFLLNTLAITSAGEVLTYLRITQLGYLLDLMLCMVVILFKFADKFTEAEQLVLQLDAKVEERTVQLKEAQQREHDMMTHIFHDLRTPVFHLQGYVDMMEAQPEECVQLLPLMKERVEYLTMLSEQLFLAAKLEDGAVSFHYHEVSISSLCAHLIENLTITARSKHIKIKNEIEPLPMLVTDGFRVQQILENLLDNAIKYTPEDGSIILTLKAIQNGQVVTVMNTGKGIPEKDISRVFERLYHGAAPGSSGMGLYIAHTLCERLGGELRVESRDGMTAFTAVFPTKSSEMEGENEDNFID